MERSCDGCTKCCDGHLGGEVQGKTFYAGKPCHFVALGRGCSIYDDRPVDPCQSYECSWRKSEALPMWMKPSEVNVIVDERVSPAGHQFIRLHEAGGSLDSRVLSWAIEFALEYGLNLFWTVDSGKHWIGSKEFCAEAVKL